MQLKYEQHTSFAVTAAKFAHVLVLPRIVTYL